MRVSDTLIGSVLLLLSLAVLWHIQSFPDFPGQQHGPALFPGVVAGALALASLELIRTGLRSRAPLLQLAGTNLYSLVPFATTVAGLFFYYLLSDRLGFIVCALIVLSALMWSFGVRRSLVLPVAFVSTMIIHTGFFKFLKVPLPWGLLQPVAW